MYDGKLRFEGEYSNGKRNGKGKEYDWEFMKNEEVSDIVYRFEDSKDANTCARKIVERARQIWEKTGFAIDDITCVVVFFKEI